jgi:hypothetical protein
MRSQGKTAIVVRRSQFQANLEMLAQLTEEAAGGHRLAMLSSPIVDSMRAVVLPTRNGWLLWIRPGNMDAPALLQLIIVREKGDHFDYPAPAYYRSDPERLPDVDETAVAEAVELMTIWRGRWDLRLIHPDEPST